MQYFLVATLASLCGIALGSLIKALIVQLATNTAIKFKPPYKMAYKTAFIASLAASAFYLVFELSLSGFALQHPGVSLSIELIIAFFINAYLFSFLLKSPTEGAIGFGKAIKVLLYEMLFFIVICLVVGVLIAGFLIIRELFFI